MKFFDYTLKLKSLKDKLNVTKFYEQIHFILSEAYMGRQIKVCDDGFSFSTPMNLTNGDLREMGTLIAQIPGLDEHVKIYTYIDKKTGEPRISRQLFVRRH